MNYKILSDINRGMKIPLASWQTFRLVVQDPRPSNAKYSLTI